MNKIIKLALLPLIGLVACNEKPVGNEKFLQARLDNLESKLNKTYKPGFGDFMMSIQTHHAKLWFAGQNKNWSLADFEIHELMETIEDIESYQSERQETKEITILKPALNKMHEAIEAKDLSLFNSNYKALTNTCNSCHSATDGQFNIIKVPNTNPFVNQDFKDYTNQKKQK